MSAATDALRLKTDDELRFFVQHPHFYQPELVAAARRELQHRGSPLRVAAEPAARPAEAGPAGVAPAATPAAAARPVTHEAQAGYTANAYDANAYDAEPARPPVRPLGVLAGLLPVAGIIGFWWYSHHTATAAADRQAAAAEAARLSPEALKLETVATYELPTFDVPQLVAEQLASVPASQKQNEQALRQFRALSKRFWAAETQSEFLLNAANTHATVPTVAAQAEQVREAWQAWNHAAVYTFRFGPEMKRQFELMRQVASSEQHMLTRLPQLLPQDEFRADRELTARQADVQAWMAGLRRTSPVTGKQYKVEVLEYRP